MDVISKEKVGPRGRLCGRIKFGLGNGDSVIKKEILIRAPFIAICMSSPLTFF